MTIKTKENLSFCFWCTVICIGAIMVGVILGTAIYRLGNPTIEEQKQVETITEIDLSQEPVDEHQEFIENWDEIITAAKENLALTIDIAERLGIDIEIEEEK